MSTFNTLRQQARKTVDLLSKTYDLDKKLVQNVIQYARCLPKVDGSDEIDGLIFRAEMSNHFNLSSRFLLTSMFSVIKEHAAITATVNEYIKLICLFLSDNIDMKIDWVFKVYDTNKDGNLSWIELYTLLKPCIMDPDLEPKDLDEAVKELVDIVIKLTDIDMNGSIDLEEFRALVKNNILYLELLGPCLPGDVEKEKFYQELRHKTPHQVRNHFRCQRSRSLGEFMPEPRSSKFYPVLLEMP